MPVPAGIHSPALHVLPLAIAVLAFAEVLTLRLSRPWLVFLSFDVGVLRLARPYDARALGPFR